MSKNKRLRSILFTVLYLLTVVQNCASGVTDEQIKSQGILPALKEYCATFTLGQVKSQAAISMIDNPEERKTCERELVKARQTAKDFALFCQHLQKSDLSEQEKIDVLGLMSELQTKILRRGPIAIGNLELACALSMLASGVYFDLYSTADETARLFAFHILDKMEISVGLVSDALKADHFVPSQGKDNATLGDEVVKLVFGAEDTNRESEGASRSPLDTLAKDLQGKVTKASLADQLNEPDSKWLAWDLMLAIRLHALCRLSLHLPLSRPDQPDTATAHRQFMRFQAAFSNELLGIQQHVINASFPPASSVMQRDGYIVLEINRQIKDRGHHILDMLCHRLGVAE